MKFDPTKGSYYTFLVYFGILTGSLKLNENLVMGLEFSIKNQISITFLRDLLGEDLSKSVTLPAPQYSITNQS
jgi:hypothetical protein